MNDHQINEIKKCARSPIYFIQKYLKIQHSSRTRTIPFKLYAYQKRMIRNYHKNNLTIIDADRQKGKSITSLAYILHYAIFNEKKVCALISPNRSMSYALINVLHMLYDSIPEWMKPELQPFWNKSELNFDNYSRISAFAATDHALSGRVVSLLYCDELDHVAKEKESFYINVLPALSTYKNRKIMITGKYIEGKSSLYQDLYHNDCYTKVKI